MPEKPHHSFEFHLSTPDDIRATWTKELHTCCIKYSLWYAIKHEIGESGKLHLHMAFIREIGEKTYAPNAGAMTASNFRRFVLHKCNTLKQYMLDNPSRHALVVTPMKSDFFIAEYLQKEGELQYFYTPRDLLEIRPYFADLLKAKIQNPEYDRWELGYKTDNLQLPATNDSVFAYFHYHMFIANDIKIVSDPKKLKERCIALRHKINKEVPESPFATKPKNTSSDYEFRVCPRCEEKDVDAPNLLRPREQFCDGCKNY